MQTRCNRFIIDIYSSRMPSRRSLRSHSNKKDKQNSNNKDSPIQMALRSSRLNNPINTSSSRQSRNDSKNNKSTPKEANTTARRPSPTSLPKVEHQQNMGRRISNEPETTRRGKSQRGRPPRITQTISVLELKAQEESRIKKQIQKLQTDIKKEQRHSVQQISESDAVEQEIESQSRDALNEVADRVRNKRFVRLKQIKLKELRIRDKQELIYVLTFEDNDTEEEEDQDFGWKELTLFGDVINKNLRLELLKEYLIANYQDA